MASKNIAAICRKLGYLRPLQDDFVSSSGTERRSKSVRLVRTASSKREILQTFVPGKKGVSVWISWVMLVAFAVLIGVLVLQWSRSSTEKTVDDLTEQGAVLTLCQETGLSVTGYCQKTQTLNMNITNSNNRQLDGLMLRGFDIYDRPFSIQKNITLEPGKARSITIVKQGVLEQAEIMPIIIINKNRAVCQSRKIALQDIGFC